MSSKPPRLIVGLGNPGAEYTETRHNAGFWFCERLADMMGVRFTRESRFHGQVGKGPEGVWLLMPDTFMNRSGQSVGAVARFYRIAPDEILVIHDELDIPPGQARLKFGGGLGGHNGLKDITSHCGTQDFWRLRLGIGHPGDRNAVVSYVLKPPRKEEHEAIDTAMERALSAWPDIARGAFEVATQKINARPARGKEATP
ncbi:aminoacyl-tRNA hydrolase [Denitromonas ohlonensis]|jgi:PTH1 family peptidyl-tRNA hydrolase|uniref:Peptidyl-tRNA hydrolase n=2 Tax=Denitromonas TaxID=139331 RepID=A0A558EFT0_9RHOO|nr:aminoacyl-tRNA hydrolase [Denitromonas ohlonensis]TVO64804.1 aminoacyl-tRNA hydrolase [Denitromonas ohlonensis]TVO70409.1 aminoacyl-tRNA hydrolase [Denitromonas ohlonensis]TVT46994.1 MAG: aminoacyl-tRNA hydrolase [Denitromonas halophila]TVT71933.1 MAG: aminoacyl-tRNA hydrolase [Denitromonas halophila]